MSDDDERSGHPGGHPADAPARGRRRARPEPTPTQRALGLLVRREHSRKELSRKLAARGVARDDAEAAIDRLSDAGWQDDARFAELLVRSRAETGHGPLRIRAELQTHGLDREAVALAMATYDGQWDRLAREAVERRFGAAIHWLVLAGAAFGLVRYATGL